MGTRSPEPHATPRGLFRRARHHAPLLVLPLLVLACDAYAPARSLSGVLPGGHAAESPDCAQCHTNPPRDRIHSFHLVEHGRINELNGTITCLDCHFESLQHAAERVIDTIFEDASGNVYASYDYPWKTDFDRTGLSIIEIDTFHFPYKPIPAGPSPDAKGYEAQWMTARAHFDGTLDIAFAPNLSASGTATWNPRTMGCSAIGCHRDPQDEYSFESASGEASREVGR